MVDREFHKDTDKPLEATLPRDLTNTNVTMYWGENEKEYETVDFVDRASGVVKAGIKKIDPDPGVYEVHFKIEYEDGTVEVLPPRAKHVRVTE